MARSPLSLLFSASSCTSGLSNPWRPSGASRAYTAHFSELGYSVQTGCNPQLLVVSFLAAVELRNLIARALKQSVAINFDMLVFDELEVPPFLGQM